MVFHLLQRRYNILSKFSTISSKFPIKLFLLVLLPYQVHLANSISDNNNSIEKPDKVKMALEQFAKNSYAFGADLYKVRGVIRAKIYPF